MTKYTLLFFVFVFALSLFFINTNSVEAQVATSDCVITSTLRLGSTGSEVACLQSQLGIMVDGKFGPATKAAVMAWQVNNGLTADGVLGALSRAVLTGTYSSSVTVPISAYQTSTYTGTAPQITSLSTTSGSIGNRVQITGSNFTASGNTVHFGPELTLNNLQSSNNGTAIYFDVPSGIASVPYPPGNVSCPSLSKLVIAGNYPVSVENGSGKSNEVSFAVTSKSVAQLQYDLSANLMGNAGGDPVNKSKNVIVCAQTPSQFDAVTDAYFATKSASSNWDGNSWGRQWLSQFSVYLYGVKGWQLKSQLSQDQKTKMKMVLADGTMESHLKYDNCITGGNGNSCSEDYVGFVMAIAAAKLNDVSVSDSLEEQYVQKVFGMSASSNAPGLGLTKEQKSWDDILYTKMYNHGGENPVYAGLLFVHMNDAAYAYSLKQNSSVPSLPSYYVQPSMKDLFSWIQSKTKSDGSGYLNTCHTTSGAPFACSDTTAQTSPTAIPAGRFVRAFIGDSAFATGAYASENYDSVISGNFDVGRKMMYGDYNKKWLLSPIVPGTTTSSVAAFTDLTNNSGETYKFSVTGGPINTYGAMYKSENGGTYVKTSNWLKTDTFGAATKGPWTCSIAETDKIYIQWPDGSKTNIAEHACVASTTVSLPTVYTTAVTNITTNSATSGGNVTSDGGSPVTARGVAYNSLLTVTINNLHTYDGTGTGAFTSNFTQNLRPNTTFYVRAYATNSKGTAYGNVVSFKTNLTVTDNQVGSVLGAQGFNFTQTLRVGSQGNEVTELQLYLTRAGYDIGIADGKFGPITEAAVLKFQADKGLLKVDGIVGPEVRAVLNQ